MEPQLRAFVEALDHRLTAEDILQNVEGCLSCGQCGQACAWYTESGEKERHPRQKSDFIRLLHRRYNTLWGRLQGAFGVMPSPGLDEIRKRMPLYWACTLCGRCTLACLLGISNRSLYRAFRAACCDAGLLTDNPVLQGIIENTQRHAHSYGLDIAHIMGRAALFLEYQNIEFPLDVPDCEYLLVCPAAGNTNLPDIGTKLIALFNAAGIDYTVSSRIVDTGTEVEHISCHDDLSREMLLRWEAEAERLNSRIVVVAGCGCDVRTLYVDVHKILGRPFRFPFVNIDTLIRDALSSGRLPVVKLDQSLTFHDPCYMTRLAGMGDLYREIISYISDRFIECQPNREHNYCCNGGAGGLRLPENKEARLAASRLKAHQLKETGADQYVTSCAVCFLTLKETSECYNLAKPDNRRVFLLYELVYQAMMRAFEQEDAAFEPSFSKGSTPAVANQYGGNSSNTLSTTLQTRFRRIEKAPSLKRIQHDRQRLHTSAGLLRSLSNQIDPSGRPFLSTLKERLRNDPIAIRFDREHPGFFDFLENFPKDHEPAEPEE